jgi:Flp pilus assembly protein TadG
MMHLKKLNGNDRGQSLVEFALVLPVLALLLMGIIDFGRIISAQLIISDAARDAARYASVGNVDTQVGQVISSDTNTLGKTVSWNVSPSDSQRQSGDSVSVGVSYSVSIFDPLLAVILGKTYTVQSTMAMRVE